MQSQEPPSPDGDPRSTGGHARHRRRRTDPPVPPDGAPLIRQDSPPRTVADHLSRRGGDGARGSAPAPPWAQDRADPDRRLEEATAAQADQSRAAQSDHAASQSDHAAAQSDQDTAQSDRDDEPESAAWSSAFTATVGSVDEPPKAAGPEAVAASGPEDPGSRYSEVADSPDLAVEPEYGDTRSGRATAWFDDGGPPSPATGVPAVPAAGREPDAPTTGEPGQESGTASDPAGAGDRSSAATAAAARIQELAPEQAGTAGGEPGGPPPQPVPRPRPSPGPRRPAPEAARDDRAARTPDADSGVAGQSSHVPAQALTVPGDRGAAGDAAARAAAGSLRGGGTAVDHTGPRPVAPETPQETTGPVLDRPLRDGTPGDPPTGADLGGERLEPAPRRRRTLSPDTDRTRTVSEAARERGLPVRDLTEPAATAPGTGHGHGHGHTPATPAGKRVRILLAALLVPCALAALAGVALLWPGTSPLPAVPPQQQVHGTVAAVQAADCTPGTGSGGCTGVTVRMSDGPRAGSDLVQLVPAEPSTPRFAVGDAIVLGYSGGNPDEAGSYQITDFQRGMPLVWLAAAFAVAVIALGRWRGLAALVALGLSFAVLVFFVLPSILSGNSPLAVAVTGAGVIMFVVLYLSHGISARTSCAVLGTLISLALIGGLGALFTATTRLTGLDDTTSNLIGTLGDVPIDARGLVLAGLVIGALGVLDDVTVTQASAVWELRDANPTLGTGKLFAAGMRIGRDHVSSAVNTLVLAYAGAALPLMLLFTVSSASFGQVVTSQDVGTEIVRTLVGSIGLVASVPLTTGLAAVVAARR